MKKKLLIVVNDPGFFLSHRLPIALEARREGYDVHIATGPGASSIQEIKRNELAHHLLPLSRSGKNIFKEVILLFTFWLLFFRVKPEIVHLVTIKPVVYGGVAARLAGVPCLVSAISGLGYSFTSTDFKAKIVKLIVSILLKLSLRHKNIRIILQNPDDRDFVMKSCGIRKDQTELIRGSGVDLDQYKYIPEDVTGSVKVVLVARLLRDKGVFEFFEAAKRLKLKYTSTRFQLIGSVDPGNPTSISEDQVKEWVESKVVEISGYSSQISKILPEANIVVLPSYREGLPKALAEAAACGRAVVTTDVPGCRDAIISNETGLLVPVKNVESLADAIESLIVNSELRMQMGAAGRRFAEAEFDVKRIVRAHLSLYQDLIDSQS